MKTQADLKKLRINKRNLQLFWYWINERHMIYLKKSNGDPKPWTKDPILQQYKFTNPFRENDAGTIWLRKNFIEPHRSDGPILLFNIIYYRWFNWIDTARDIGYVKRFNPVQFYEKLRARKNAGLKIFTGAHMSHGEKGISKVDSVFREIKTTWKDREDLYQEITYHNTLEHAFKVLDRRHLLGPFISYEIVTDLYHTPILDKAPDINTWANPGPGCKRGLRRIWPEINPPLLLEAMKYLLRISPDHLGEHVPRLELRDCEHSACEFDKYARTYYDEGRPRATYPGVS